MVRIDPGFIGRFLEGTNLREVFFRSRRLRSRLALGLL
jgi:hypothetical protein